MFRFVLLTNLLIKCFLYSIGSLYWKHTRQIHYVYMGKQQEGLYKEAIENYRAASQARMPKLSGTGLNNAVGILPQRQISNYFLEFRKVLKAFDLY